LSEFSARFPEYVFIAQLILKYQSGNWDINSVVMITGNRYSQTSIPGGSYLTAVTTDATLTGAGTPASPLSVVGGSGGGDVLQVQIFS
jgi:hypothetical protein